MMLKRMLTIAAAAAFILAGIGGVANAAPEDSQTTEATEQKITSEDMLMLQYKRKEPVVSFLLSLLVPGAGQYYNGESGKGTVMLVGSIVGLSMFVAGAEDNIGNWDVDDDDGIGGFGALLWLGGALWSVIDAPIAANRINEQNMQRLQLGAILPTRGNPDVGMFVTMKF